VRINGVPSAASIVAGAIAADEARQALRAAVARDDPEVDLGLANLRRV